MVSATSDEDLIKKNVLPPRNGNGQGSSILRNHTSPSQGEKSRRSINNTIIALEHLAKGLMPFEVRRAMNITPHQYVRISTRINKLAVKYQSRKIEELVFLAELRHNKVYREALEAFEQSKKDKDGKARPGNPIFLSVANESLRDIRKLLGLDKSADFINNGNMAILNWDSIHSANTQPEVQAIATVDPIEERIRELEKIAQEREYLLKETITNEENEVLEDTNHRVIELNADDVISSSQETVEPEPVKKVKLKIKPKVIVASTIDDMCAV